MQLYCKNATLDEYEISRFSTKCGYCVKFGFSRLLKHLPKGTAIINFVDRRYGDGSHLIELGFVEESCYLSFKWTNCQSETWHRMKFPGNSGYDEGLVKIWDCGQAKFVKRV